MMEIVSCSSECRLLAVWACVCLCRGCFGLVDAKSREEHNWDVHVPLTGCSALIMS